MCEFNIEQSVLNTIKILKLQTSDKIAVNILKFDIISNILLVKS